MSTSSRGQYRQSDRGSHGDLDVGLMNMVYAHTHGLSRAGKTVNETLIY